jgi:3-methyladenine DNA glycosylase AlkD
MAEITKEFNNDEIDNWAEWQKEIVRNAQRLIIGQMRRNKDN